MFLFVLGVLSLLNLVSANLECDACKEGLKEIDHLLETNRTVEFVEEVATKVCEFLRAAGQCKPPYDSWQCKQVCSGLLSL